MGKAAFWAIGIIMLLGVGYAFGVSSGLSWNGNSAIHQGVIQEEEARNAVAGRLEDCMKATHGGIHTRSLAESCLAGTEEDYEKDENEKYYK